MGFILYIQYTYIYIIYNIFAGILGRWSNNAGPFRWLVIQSMMTNQLAGCCMWFSISSCFCLWCAHCRFSLLSLSSSSSLFCRLRFWLCCRCLGWCRVFFFLNRCRLSATATGPTTLSKDWASRVPGRSCSSETCWATGRWGASVGNRKLTPIKPQALGCTRGGREGGGRGVPSGRALRQGQLLARLQLLIANGRFWIWKVYFCNDYLWKISFLPTPTPEDYCFL